MVKNFPKKEFNFAAYPEMLTTMNNVTKRTDFATGEEITLNTDFTQLYDNSAGLMIQLADNPTAMKLFWWIISHMDRKNALVVSQSTLAEQLKCTDRTIRNALADLKLKEVVTILKSGNTNIYCINANIAWKGNADDKKYAQFEATVFLSESEQEKQYKTSLVGHAVPKKPSPRARQKTLDNLIGLSGSAAMMAISIFSFAQLFA